jgi:hypothetical protein
MLFSGHWNCSPPNNVQRYSAPSSRCEFKTYHCVDQIGNGVNECPDPLAVGLRVDGTGQRANGRTPRALLGVHLHEMKVPKQMLWAATLWDVETLKDGYICNVPLPRVPRIQSASLATLEPSQCIMAGTEPSRCTMAGHAPAITYYSRAPQVPMWSDLTRSLSGCGRRTLLPFFPVRLM